MWNTWSPFFREAFGERWVNSPNSAESMSWRNLLPVLVQRPRGGNGRDSVIAQPSPGPLQARDTESGLTAVLCGISLSASRALFVLPTAPIRKIATQCVRYRQCITLRLQPTPPRIEELASRIHAKCGGAAGMTAPS